MRLLTATALGRCIPRGRVVTEVSCAQSCGFPPEPVTPGINRVCKTMLAIQSASVAAQGQVLRRDRCCAWTGNVDIPPRPAPESWGGTHGDSITDNSQCTEAGTARCRCRAPVVEPSFAPKTYETNDARPPRLTWIMRAEIRPPRCSVSRETWRECWPPLKYCPPVALLLDSLGRPYTTHDDRHAESIHRSAG